MDNKFLEYFGIGAFLAGTTMFATDSCNAGYTGKCDDTLTSVREEFTEACESSNKSTLHDGKLDDILKRRDEVLKEAGCELNQEKWMCGEYSTDGSYKVRFDLAEQSYF